MTALLLFAPSTICPRCKRRAVGWPLKRGDKCSPKGWVACIREPEVVLKERRRLAAKD